MITTGMSNISEHDRLIVLLNRPHCAPEPLAHHVAYYEVHPGIVIVVRPS